MQSETNKINTSANSTKLAEELPAINQFFSQAPQTISAFKKYAVFFSKKDCQKFGAFIQQIYSLSELFDRVYRQQLKIQINQEAHILKSGRSRQPASKSLDCSKCKKDGQLFSQIEHLQETKSRLQKELCDVKRQILQMVDQCPEKVLNKELSDAKKKIRDNEEKYHKQIDNLNYKLKLQKLKCPIISQKTKLSRQSKKIKTSEFLETPPKQKPSISVPKKRPKSYSHFTPQIHQENDQDD